MFINAIVVNEFSLNRIIGSNENSVVYGQNIILIKKEYNNEIKTTFISR